MGLTLDWLKVERKQDLGLGYSQRQACADSVLLMSNQHPQERAV